MAAVYIGLVTVAGLISGMTTNPEANSWTQDVSLPGLVLLFVFVAQPLDVVFGHPEGVMPEPVGSVIAYALSAVVNVLLVWGLVASCRVVRAEWRRHPR
ncbi:hypothetical protein [Streptomyces sp. NPDC004726]